jgi:hypothetical protein
MPGICECSHQPLFEGLQAAVGYFCSALMIFNQVWRLEDRIRVVKFRKKIEM